MIIVLVMIPKEITVTEAARNFSELVNRVHYQGRSTILLKGGKPMVKIIPVHRAKTGAELAVLWVKGPRLSLAEAESFERDINESRRGLRPLTSKWD